MSNEQDGLENCFGRHVGVIFLRLNLFIIALVSCEEVVDVEGVEGVSLLQVRQGFGPHSQHFPHQSMYPSSWSMYLGRSIERMLESADRRTIPQVAFDRHPGHRGILAERLFRS